MLGSVLQNLNHGPGAEAEADEDHDHGGDQGELGEEPSHASR